MTLVFVIALRERVASKGGVIFSDGVERDYIAFNSGVVATVGLAERKAHLIVRG